MRRSEATISGDWRSGDAPTGARKSGAMPMGAWSSVAASTGACRRPERICAGGSSKESEKACYDLKVSPSEMERGGTVRFNANLAVVFYPLFLV